MKYKVNKGFITQKLDNSNLILFEPETSLLYTFNPTAAYIFRLLKKGYSANYIINVMQKKYSISKNKATQDFNHFVYTLKKEGILLE